MLLHLPIELQFEIIQYLRPLYIKGLRYTCNQLDLVCKDQLWSTPKFKRLLYSQQLTVSHLEFLSSLPIRYLRTSDFNLGYRLNHHFNPENYWEYGSCYEECLGRGESAYLGYDSILPNERRTSEFLRLSLKITTFVGFRVEGYSPVDRCSLSVIRILSNYIVSLDLSALSGRVDPISWFSERLPYLNSFPKLTIVNIDKVADSLIENTGISTNELEILVQLPINRIVLTDIESHVDIRNEVCYTNLGKL